MLALPGTVYLFQGEELGLEDVEDLPEELLRDPTWLAPAHDPWPRRRSCAAAVVRHRAAFGFGPDGSTTWPPTESWRDRTVEAETGDPASFLSCIAPRSVCVTSISVSAATGWPGCRARRRAPPTVLAASTIDRLPPIELPSGRPCSCERTAARERRAAARRRRLARLADRDRRCARRAGRRSHPSPRRRQHRPETEDGRMPDVLYSNPPTMFATIAPMPNPKVWYSDWPVAWSSDGRSLAIVRTTHTRIQAKATPVMSRVAMITAAESITIQEAVAAPYMSALVTNMPRSPIRRDPGRDEHRRDLRDRRDPGGERHVRRRAAQVAESQGQIREPADDRDVDERHRHKDRAQARGDPEGDPSRSEPGARSGRGIGPRCG